jgi:hypothetical protein
MLKVQTILSIGLLSTIVPLEILGLTNLATTLSPNPSDESSAIAAPRRPFGRTAGGKRGVCQTTQTQPSEQLIAFLSESSDAADLTTTKAPTFYFYVADAPKDIASLEFRLAYASGDRRGTGVINPPLKVSAPTPGVVKVQLPEVLEKETPYHWAFTLRCQGSRETASIKGIVVYRELDARVQAQLAQATSAQDKAKIYAQQSSLVDAVSVLMANTQLQAKGFDAIATEMGLDQFSRKAIEEGGR